MEPYISKLIIYFLVVVACHATNPAPPANAAHCSLTVWDRDTFDNVTKTTMNARDGSTVSLSCELRCPGTEEEVRPPKIEWLGPRYTRIRSNIGRIFVSSGESRWILILYVQSISDEDVGVYTCHVKGGASVHVELDMEAQAEEFTNLETEEQNPEEIF